MSGGVGENQQKSDEAYEHKETLKYASAVGLQAGVVGAFVSTLQNALGKHRQGAAGVLTRSGGTIGFFAAAGAAFGFTEAYVANVRQTNDALNGAAGGCAAGFLAGLRARSLPSAVGSCVFLGGVMGAFDASGQILGDRSRVDSPEKIEERRRQFFKPGVSLSEARE